MNVVHADCRGEGRLSVNLQTDAVRTVDIHLVRIFGWLDREIGGLPLRERRGHVLYGETEVVDDGSSGWSRRFPLAQHDEYAWELNELQRPTLHKSSTHHRNPELFLGIHVLDDKMNVPHRHADLVRFGELRCGGHSPEKCNRKECALFHGDITLPVFRVKEPKLPV